VAVAARLVAALALLSGAVLTTSCSSDPRTEIIVAVYSDFAVPSELSRISIDVRSPSGQMSSAVADLGGAAAALPRTLGMSYEGGPIGPFTVTVNGMLGTSVVVSRVARVYFGIERTLVLRIDLLRSCMGSTCAGEMTCAAGGCRALDIASSELFDYTGSLSGGGPATDAGSDPCASCMPAHATPSCSGGTCGIASCDAMFADCDGMAGNGCEVDLSTSRNDCGMCGNRCSGGGARCCAGTCRSGGGGCP